MPFMNNIYLLPDYSLIESCDIVGIDPLAWLKDVLDNLRDDTGQEEMKQMLPFYYKKTRK